MERERGGQHGRAAATGNALSPTAGKRVRRTSRDVDEAERSLQCLLWKVGYGGESGISVAKIPILM